jgi:hypothetical protein
MQTVESQPATGKATSWPSSLVRTKLERVVWRKVQRAQAKNEPRPTFTATEAEALQRPMGRYEEALRRAERAAQEIAIRRWLKQARAWAYANVIGFRRHHALFHPDLIAWAEEHGTGASDAQRIEAARSCHEARPIPLNEHADTEPASPANVGRPQRIRAARPQVEAAASAH